MKQENNLGLDRQRFSNLFTRKYSEPITRGHHLLIKFNNCTKPVRTHICKEKQTRNYIRHNTNYNKIFSIVLNNFPLRFY